MIRFTFFLLFLISVVSAQKITYTIDTREAAAHYLNVRIEVENASEKTLQFTLPAWSPGRYVIYDFAKHVQQVSAHSGAKTLPVQRLNKQSWQINLENENKVSFDYRIYTATRNGTFSLLEESGASLNFPSILMYVDGLRQLPVVLNVKTKPEWQVATSLSLENKRQYRAENYEHLLDCPMEIGDLSTFRFTVLGKPHRMVFRQDFNPALKDRLITDVSKIIKAEAAVFGGKLPYDHYTFFMHINPDESHPDGMEHRNGSFIGERMDSFDMQPDVMTNDDYDNLIWLIAHEYFHLWNVKRLRPQHLGPFDFTKEANTHSLWLAEGFTSYYAYMAMIRSGLYDAKKFYAEFAKNFSRQDNSSANAVRSLIEVSRMTWLFLATPNTFEKNDLYSAYYSYYRKGMLVGLMTDLAIRRQTDNKVTLDDVMLAMYQEFYEGARDSYYMPGHGYTPDDFFDMVVAMAGDELRADLQHMVVEAGKINYAKYLDYAGLRIDDENTGKKGFGAVTSEADGQIKITKVFAAGTAASANLQQGDILLTIDGRKVSAGQLKHFAETFVDRPEITIDFIRDGKARNATAKVLPAAIRKYVIEADPEASGSSQAIRDSWMRGPHH